MLPGSKTGWPPTLAEHCNDGLLLHNVSKPTSVQRLHSAASGMQHRNAQRPNCGRSRPSLTPPPALALPCPLPSRSTPPRSHRSSAAPTAVTAPWPLPEQLSTVDFATGLPRRSVRRDLRHKLWRDSQLRTGARKGEFDRGLRAEHPLSWGNSVAGLIVSALFLASAAFVASDGLRLHRAQSDRAQRRRSMRRVGGRR
jgi:hypothetical protein